MHGEAGLHGSFEWVQGGLLHRTSLNNCDAGESRPTGKFCESFWWFDCTQHPWTNRAVSRDQGGLTTVNLLEPLCWLGKQAYRAGLSEFEVVQQHRNSTNHCDSGWFQTIEPPRTHALHRDKGLQDNFTWIQSGSNLSNLLEPLRYRNNRIISLQFRVVQTYWTSSNPCTTDGQRTLW